MPNKDDKKIKITVGKDIKNWTKSLPKDGKLAIKLVQEKY